jgi:hypothetical protein
MATKESGNVTITLARTTVAMLRAKKKDLETWDGLMHRLYARQRKYGIECTICGKFIETENMDTSPNMLAKEQGWQPLYSGRVEEVATGEIKTTVELGYICPSCGDSK